MKNNKKLKIASASLLGLGLVAAGSFAFLSDSASTLQQSKVGQVGVNADMSISHIHMDREAHAWYKYSSLTGNPPNLDGFPTYDSMFVTAPDNINPGDNDPNVPIENEQGTDHEINISIENTGTKSIITRLVLELTGVKADGKTKLTAAELQDVLISYDTANSFPGMTSVHGTKDTFALLPQMTPAKNANTTIVYTIGGDKYANYDYIPDAALPIVSPTSLPASDLIKSEFILSGVPVANASNVETETYELKVAETIADGSKLKYKDDNGTFYYVDIDEYGSMRYFDVNENYLYTQYFDYDGSVVYYNDLTNTEVVLTDATTPYLHVIYKSTDDAGNPLTCPTKANIKLDLGLRTYEKDANGNYEVNTPSALEGAKLTLTLKVQGMQYRNTGANEWETLFTSEKYINVGN